MRLFIILIVILANLTFVSYSQVVTVDGYAHLQNQSSDTNIAVIFTRTAPSITIDTVYTDASGYFKKQLEIGIYQIIYSKQNFYPDTLNEVKLFEVTKLDAVTLQMGGLYGRISGTLKKGNYVVNDTIFVLFGDTLILEPGVNLFFKKKAAIYLNDGTLYACGTEKDSIMFTRFLAPDDNPDSTYWEGIDCTAPLTLNTLKYCHLSYSKCALSTALTPITFQNSLISDCKGKYIVQIYNCNPIISNIKFINNESDDTDTLSIRSCLFLNFTHGTYGKSNIAVINNVEITGVKSKNMTALRLLDAGPNELNNLYIHDNAGPAINYARASNYVVNNIYNTTIVNNGGGVRGGVGLNIINSIIANNTNFSFDKTTVINSDIFGNSGVLSAQDKWVGVNVKKNKNGDSCDVYDNITLDPQFTDVINQDYTLSPSSPCIDAGVNDSVSVIYDFENHRRIWDGNLDGDPIVDLGAFESGAPIQKTILSENFDRGILEWNVQSNNGYEWRLKNNTGNAHSGKCCLVLSNDISSTVTTNFFTLTDGIDNKLTFWLNINPGSITKGSSDLPLGSAFNFAVNIISNIPENSKIEAANITINKSGWNKYSVNLSNYSGKSIALEFFGNISQNGTSGASLLFDDIFVGEEENTSVDDGNVSYSNNELSISPNPASDYITISEPSDAHTLKGVVENVRFYDVFGQEVSDGLHFEGGAHLSPNVRIDVSALPAGVYFVRVGEKISKFVKI